MYVPVPHKLHGTHAHVLSTVNYSQTVFLLFSSLGRNSSPTSNYLLTSEVPEAALICVGVWSALCEVYIIFLIVFNLVWRENKYGSWIDNYVLLWIVTRLWCSPLIVLCLYMHMY